MPKQMLSDGEARASLKSGMNLRVKSRTLTLDPRGRNVIIKKKYRKPLRIIVQNAGYETAVDIQKILESDDNFGLNAQNLPYENFVAYSMIDPAKIARTAIRRATSMADVFLTLECVIAETQKNILCQ